MTERKLWKITLENVIYDWNFHFLRERQTENALESFLGHVSRVEGPKWGPLVEALRVFRS